MQWPVCWIWHIWFVTYVFGCVARCSWTALLTVPRIRHCSRQNPNYSFIPCVYFLPAILLLISVHFYALPEIILTTFDAFFLKLFVLVMLFCTIVVCILVVVHRFFSLYAVLASQLRMFLVTLSQFKWFCSTFALKSPIFRFMCEVFL